MLGDCCSQGFHGYLHAWLASHMALPNPTHLAQAHLLAMSLNYANWLCSSFLSYRNVTVSNFTTSWRDGLAFCSLIHRHRCLIIIPVNCNVIS